MFLETSGGGPTFTNQISASRNQPMWSRSCCLQLATKSVNEDVSILMDGRSENNVTKMQAVMEYEISV
jgi:hypothetical protein